MQTQLAQQYIKHSSHNWNIHKIILPQKVNTRTSNPLGAKLHQNRVFLMKDIIGEKATQQGWAANETY
jgi:hypothetical protein